jgi:hypothetical protein
VRITLYVHGARESGYDAGEKAGLEGEALRMFSFAATEHEIEYEVDSETGAAVAVKIDGRGIGPVEQA